MLCIQLVLRSNLTPPPPNTHTQKSIYIYYYIHRNILSEIDLMNSHSNPPRLYFRLLSAAAQYQASSDISCLCYRQDKEVIMEKCVTRCTPWSISSATQISRSHYMYSSAIQTTEGYSHTSPAAANSVCPSSEQGEALKISMYH